MPGDGCFGLSEGLGFRKELGVQSFRINVRAWRNGVQDGGR